MQDSCPYTELTLAVDAGASAGAGSSSSTTCLCLRLRAIAIPSGFPSNLKIQNDWPQLPHPGALTVLLKKTGTLPVLTGSALRHAHTHANTHTQTLTPTHVPIPTATRPKAHICRWSPLALLQLVTEIPAHCAFTQSGPFLSDRIAWSRLLSALRSSATATSGAAAAGGFGGGGGGGGAAAGAGMEGDEMSCQESGTSEAAGVAERQSGGRSGGGRGRGRGRQQQQAAAPPSAPLPPQQQQRDQQQQHDEESEGQALFDSVLVMRIAGLHIDSHIKVSVARLLGPQLHGTQPPHQPSPGLLPPHTPSNTQLLLVPVDPPGGGAPLLLGYLMLYSWKPSGVDDTGVPTTCGIAPEEARRCLMATAGSRATAG
jgi:hypothetical protein